MHTYGEGRERYGKVYELWGPEIDRCPELGEALKQLQEVAEIRRRIRDAFGVETAAELERHLGETLNGNPVTEEAVAHARVVDEAYAQLEAEVKRLMAEVARGER